MAKISMHTQHQLANEQADAYDHEQFGRLNDCHQR